MSTRKENIREYVYDACKKIIRSDPAGYIQITAIYTEQVKKERTQRVQIQRTRGL